MASKRKPAAPRARLTAERVIQCALRLLDAQGIEALSMRRLAAELGVEAMSLYSHVENKEALLAGVLDLAVEEFSPPGDQHASWQEWVRAWMSAARKVFVDHPNLFHVVHSGVPLGPKALGIIDALMSRLQTAGFDANLQLRVWRLLRAYLFGTLAQEAINPARMSLADLMTCCPHLVPVLTSQYCCDHDRLFGEGLEVILAGTEVLRAPA